MWAREPKIRQTNFVREQHTARHANFRCCCCCCGSLFVLFSSRFFLLLFFAFRFTYARELAFVFVCFQLILVNAVMFGWFSGRLASLPFQQYSLTHTHEHNTIRISINWRRTDLIFQLMRKKFPNASIGLLHSKLAVSTMRKSLVGGWYGAVCLFRACQLCLFTLVHRLGWVQNFLSKREKPHTQFGQL